MEIIFYNIALIPNVLGGLPSLQLGLNYIPTSSWSSRLATEGHNLKVKVVSEPEPVHDTDDLHR